MAFFSSLYHLIKLSSFPPKPLSRQLLFLHLSSLSLLNLSSQTRKAKKKETFSHIFQLCSKNEDVVVGREAHCHMITSGFVPTVFVSNCLIHMYIRCLNLDYARKVFDHLPLRDVVSWNAMIAGYVQNGSIHIAGSLFDLIPERDVVTWNTMISGYLQNGDPCGSINLYLEMSRTGIGPDRTTFAVVLKSCAALEDHMMGGQIHGFAVKIGLDSDVVTGSALVDMYAKCKQFCNSLQFFSEMPEKNSVSWSAVIGGCVQNEEFFDGVRMFVEMQQGGVGVSQAIYASMLRSCAGLSCVRVGSQIHGHAVKNNYSSDLVVGTAILDMYAKSDRLDDATRVFNWLPIRSLQTWNAMVVGYARNNQGFEALEKFKLMNRSGVGVDEISLSGVLSACAEINGLLQGLQAHCLAIKTGLSSDICVTNAVLDMYGKCGALNEAYGVFAPMERRDAVSWNAIITALEQNERYEETLSHFNQMLQYGMEPDEFTYGSVLKACTNLESLGSGRKIHDKVIKSGLGFDSFVGSAVVDMYCKCGDMEEAEKLHVRIESKNMVSWNAIISGYSLQRRSEEAQRFFGEMLDMGLKPDDFTYASVLDTCANLATVGLGRQIHAKIIKEKLLKDVFISSTLVDMYAKCGNMEDSLLMFEKMLVRDFVSWNALICGYSHHGLGEEALKVFERMQRENVRPNHATFVAVLRACGHVGLVDQGEQYFRLMTDCYRLEPQLEHYSCMVDLIGRCRGAHKALKLINDMPYEPDAVIWRTLLSACKIHGSVEVAEIAAGKIVQLEPEDSSAYVLLSNIYAEAGRWQQVSEMRRIMRRSGLKKEPGCSWIEVKSEMHAFLIGDKAHPRRMEIYERLDELIEEMKWIGYVPHMDVALDAEMECVLDYNILARFHPSA